MLFYKYFHLIENLQFLFYLHVFDFIFTKKNHCSVRTFPSLKKEPFHVISGSSSLQTFLKHQQECSKTTFSRCNDCSLTIEATETIIRTIPTNITTDDSATTITQARFSIQPYRICARIYWCILIISSALVHILQLTFSMQYVGRFGVEFYTCVNFTVTSALVPSVVHTLFSSCLLPDFLFALRAVFIITRVEMADSEE